MVAAQMKHYKLKELSYQFQDQSSKQLVSQPTSIKSLVRKMVDDKVQFLYP